MLFLVGCKNCWGWPSALVCWLRTIMAFLIAWNRAGRPWTGFKVCLFLWYYWFLTQGNGFSEYCVSVFPLHRNPRSLSHSDIQILLLRCLAFRQYSSEPSFHFWIYLIVAHELYFKNYPSQDNRRKKCCCCIPVHSVQLALPASKPGGLVTSLQALAKLICRCYFSESKPVFTAARWVIISHLPQLYLLSRPRMRCGADVTQSCNSANSTRYSRKTHSPVLTVFRVGPCLATSRLEVTPWRRSTLKKNPQKLKRRILKEELFIIFSQQ